MLSRRPNMSCREFLRSLSLAIRRFCSYFRQLAAWLQTAAVGCCFASYPRRILRFYHGSCFRIRPRLAPATMATWPWPRIFAS